MTRTVEEIEADIDAAKERIANLERERSLIEGKEWHDRWAAFFPANLAERLLAAAHEAAALTTGTYHGASSTEITIAEGVTMWVQFDTNIPESDDQ